MTETEEMYLDRLCEAIEKAGCNNEFMQESQTIDYSKLLKRIAISLEKIAFEKFPYSTTLHRTYDPTYENEYGRKIRDGF
jgi:hypothetical protein